MDAANIPAAITEEQAYPLLRSHYLREPQEPEGSGCLSVLALPLATTGCVLVTMLCGGGF